MLLGPFGWISPCVHQELTIDSNIYTNIDVVLAYKHVLTIIIWCELLSNWNAIAITYPQRTYLKQK